MVRLTVDPCLALLHELKSGRPVSRATLMERLRMSDAALERSLALLADVCPALSVADDSSCLSRAPDLTDPERFTELLDDDAARQLSHVALLAVCESTNTEVASMELPAATSAGHRDRSCFNVALAEFQTGGRGRQGRTWSTGFASGLCFTVARRYAALERVEPTLTLAVGVALAEALDDWVGPAVQLKWPNDLILGQGKVGGILVELTTLPGGDRLVRVGVGINCTPPEGVDQSSGALPAMLPTALSDHGTPAPERSALAARLVTGVVAALGQYRDHGFEAFRTRWQTRDALRNQPVHVVGHDQIQHAVAGGIDACGALIVTTKDGELALTSGEVRVRLQ